MTFLDTAFESGDFIFFTSVTSSFLRVFSAFTADSSAGSASARPASHSSLIARASSAAWAVDSLDISLPNFDCKFDGGKGISHLPDILLFFAKPFKDRIIQQLRGPIVNEINGLLKSALVDGIIPTQCNPK